MSADPGTQGPRLVVADADLPTRAGLRHVLQAGGLIVAGEAADADTAIAIALSERPDLALIAAELPGGCGHAIRRIASGQPGIRLIVLSAQPSGEELVEVVRAGAVGYLGRDIRVDRLPTIMRAVLAGETTLPRRHSRHLLYALRGRDERRARLAERAGVSLTDREWEVLQLLATELSTSQIAYQLEITDVTARRHISSLVAKLGVADRTGAIDLLRERSTE